MLCAVVNTAHNNGGRPSLAHLNSVSNTLQGASAARARRSWPATRSSSRSTGARTGGGECSIPFIHSSIQPNNRTEVVGDAGFEKGAESKALLTDACLPGLLSLGHAQASRHDRGAGGRHAGMHLGGGGQAHAGAREGAGEHEPRPRWGGEGGNGSMMVVMRMKNMYDRKIRGRRASVKKNNEDK